MGGPTAFSAGAIEEAHQRLGIAEEDFEEMLRILEANLIKFEVDPANTAMVLAGYRELQSQVVGRADDG